MFTYELIKHQRAVIYQGRGVTYNYDKEGKLIGQELNNNAILVNAFFIERPQISIAQIWNDDSRKIQEFIAKGKNFIASLTPVFSSLASGISKGIFTGMSAKDIGVKLGNDILDAMSQVSERVTAANALEWGGAAPISISLDLLFMNENAPVYRKEVEGLLNMSSYSGLDRLGNLKGPAGYNGMAFGIIKMDKILSGEYDGLASLFLTQNGKSVLELFRIMVVESVQITASEQLYSSVGDEPAYKWIRANVLMKTACPLPIPMAGNGQYSTLGNLLGPRNY